ncbi:MAG: DMT family transporter [Candidatus Puniceispirillaceae bacterium]
MSDNLAVEGRQERVALGISLMLGAYLLFSFIDVGAKWLALLGLPSTQLAFMRYAPHFLVSSAIIVRTHKLSFLTSSHAPMLIFRGSLLMGSTILNFFAVRYLPLTLTSTILFSAPLMACMLSQPMLAEKVGLFRWTAVLFGFAGVIIAIRPFDESFHWAALLSLGGAFCFALYALLTRKYAGRVSTDVMQFYSGAVGTICLLPFAILSWQNPVSATDWVIMVSLGIFGWAGHQLLTQAHRFAATSILMPFGYSFILFLTIWSYLIFDHLPDRWTLIGGSIVVLSGLFIWFRETRILPDRQT